MRKASYIKAILLLAGMMVMGGARGMAAVLPTSFKPDSTLHSRKMEVDGLMQRQMVQSAYPVEIRMRGNQLCIVSKYCQLLPVYTQKGNFFAAFRLNRGNNWLNGLPRGTYLINNRRVTIV